MGRVRVPAALGLVFLFVASWATAAPRGATFQAVLLEPTASLTLDTPGVVLPAIGRVDGTGKTASGGTITYSTPDVGAGITVTLDMGSSLPAGVTISVSASTPQCTGTCSSPGASSDVELSQSTTSGALVSDIRNADGATTDITYTITTTGATGGSDTVTVVYTLTPPA